MAVACLVCTVVALLLVQDVQSRKLSWTEQEEETHDGLGNHGAAAGRSTTLVSVSLNLPNHCTYCYAMLNTSLKLKLHHCSKANACTLYFCVKIFWSVHHPNLALLYI